MNMKVKKRFNNLFFLHIRDKGDEGEVKLKDYISFRNRSKSPKATNYNIRTQHFYDGKPAVIEGVTYTGIKADFMNNLHIPTPYLVALAQKKAFENVYQNNTTSKQQEMLKKMSQSIDSAHIRFENARLDKEVLSIIDEFEKGVDILLRDSNKLKKALKENRSINSNLETAIENSFYKFCDIVEKIKSTQIKKTEIDNYLQELDSNINAAIQSGQSIPHFLIDATKFTNKGNNGSTSFISRLGYLSKQIKGITLLEHQGLEFFRELPIPDDYEVLNTGQLYIDGKQAGQDGLIIGKNIQIKTANGEEILLSDLLNKKNDFTKNISVSSDEWEKAVSQALGIQSKYHRAGYIKMGDIKMKDIIQLDLKQAQALRNLYILHQGPAGYEGENVSHKFNVKKSHPDYKMLFSYCLSRFMNKLINKNYYMITKQGIMDSYSYYMNLFRNSHYFAPVGAVSVYPVDKDYRIAIKENI